MGRSRTGSPVRGRRSSAIGVQIVADVRPFEAMKLRLLNAAHSALAWLAVPAGSARSTRRSHSPAFASSSRRCGAGSDTRAGHRHDRRSTGVLRQPAGALRQSRPRPPDRPDRHGRLAEAATPDSALDPREPGVNGLPIDRLALIVAAWIRYLRRHRRARPPIHAGGSVAGATAGICRKPDSFAAAESIIAQRAIFGELADCKAPDDAVGQVARADLRTAGTRQTLNLLAE